jgi:hypothetical protein
MFPSRRPYVPECVASSSPVSAGRPHRGERPAPVVLTEEVEVTLKPLRREQKRPRHLYSGLQVELTPATAEQIQRVVQARTMTAADPKSPKASKGASKRKSQPGTASPKWLS